MSIHIGQYQACIPFEVGMEIHDFFERQTELGSDLKVVSTSRHQGEKPFQT
jgi:hypothetical protein